MPGLQTQQQGPIQRSFVQGIGEEFFYENNAKEFITLNSAINLKTNVRAVLLHPLGGVLQYRWFIGQANLRTRWDIQTVAISFSLLLSNESPHPITGVDLQIALLTGSIVNNVTLISVPMKQEKGRFAESKPLKLYILELYAPASVRGEPLELEFTLLQNEPEPQLVNVALVNPTATVVLTQTFFGRH